MSNKFKKLLCGVLSAAMLLTSSSLIGFADDELGGAADADRDEHQAEEELLATPVPTEAPTATEAPAGYDYENDAYYYKALGLCQALGIITGYEDGSVQPNSVVSRAEMATIVMRALNLSVNTAYNNRFSDVDSSHWAAGTIQAAADQNIINGFEDGTFQPDGDVTTLQVWKMLICAANFGAEAEAGGGWPTGYANVANTRMDLNNGVASSDMNAGAERGNVIKMVYNALMAPFNQVVGTENGMLKYEAEFTWAKTKFNVVEDRGVLSATSTASMSDAYKPQTGYIYIDDTQYACALTGIDSYVGSNVTYYYQEDSLGGLTVLSIASDTLRNETVDIDVDDIESFDGFEEGRGQIKLVSRSRSYDVSDAVIIYNGAEITNAAFQTAKAADPDRIPASMTYDDFLRPRAGSLRLVDNDGSSGYDVVYIESYQTMVVVSATERRLTANANEYTQDGIGTAASVTLDVDTDADPDKTVTVSRDGVEARTRNLRNNDVIAVKRTIDDKSIDIINVSDSITGSISSVSTDSKGNRVAVINGTEYVVAAVAYDDCTAGREGTFYLDVFGRVGRVEATSTGGLTSSEKYGWIMTAYKDDSGSENVIRMYTQDSGQQELTLDDTVTYWDPRKGLSETLSSDEVLSQISNNIANTAVSVDSIESGFIKLNEASLIENLNDGNATNNPSADDIVQIRLVKYRTNSSNEITALYCATSGTSEPDSTTDALILNPSSLNGQASSGSLVGGYYMTDGMIVLRAPDSNDNMTDAASYSFGTATASNYLNNENGVNTVFIVGQFEDGNAPQLVVEFAGSSNDPTNIADYDSAGDNPTMVVSRIGVGIDEEDNEIYTITGYSSGAEVTYTTRKNSTLWDITGMNNRQYAGDKVWSPIEGIGGSLPDVLKEGDVIGIADNGGILMRLVKIDDIKAYVENGSTTSSLIKQVCIANGSASRDFFYFGGILQNTLGNVGILEIGGTNSSGASVSRVMEVDAARVFDLITITADGEVFYDSEGTTLGELANYDPSIKYGDLAFMRVANKGNLREVYIFRIED